MRSFRRLFVTAILALSSMASVARGASSALKCASALAPVRFDISTFRRSAQKDSERKLGTAIEILFSEPDNGTQDVIRLYNSLQHQLAYAEYRVSGDKLLDTHLVVEAEFRGEGLSKIILAQILELHPEIKSIEVELIDDNEKAFYQALGQGQDARAAFQSTPAYKIRAALGYGRITKTLYKANKRGAVGFTVEREQNQN